MKKLIDDVEEQRALFEEVHGKSLFLGGSEIATAAGLNKFQTPLQLWMVKTGRNSGMVDNIHTRLGRYMESVVAQIFNDENPTFLLKKNDSMFQHDTTDWAVCTPDYFSYLDGISNSLVEIKTSGIWADSEWQDGHIPDYALCQLQWQMGITGVHGGYVAALIGGKNYYCKKVDFNKDVFNQLLELGERFIGYIKSDTPPDATYADDLSYIRPKEKEVELPGQLESLRQFELLQKEISDLNAQVRLKEQAKDTIKNKIIQLMDDANKGICGDYVVTRKVIPIKESVRRAYEQIRFAVKNIKEKE